MTTTSASIDTGDPAAPPPPSWRRRTIRVGARTTLHLLVAVLVTWPLAAHAVDTIPLGTERAPTVPWFNVWTLEWTHQHLDARVDTGSGSWWDAPIFAPAHGSFALSDPQPLTGAAYSLLRHAGAPMPFAYDVVLLGTLTLNGLAGARLARRTGAAATVAVLTGVIAQTLPFATRELGVLQLTALYPMLFGLDALRRWAADGSTRPAVELGAWSGVAFLTSTYYGLFWLLLVPLALWRLADRTWWSKARATSAAVGVVVALAVSAPLVVGLATRTAAYERSSSTIERNSADPVDWTRLDDGALGASLAPWLADAGGSGQRLYPGTLLLALAVGGWWVGRRDPEGSRARWARACATVAVAAALLSFGAAVAVGSWHPYDVVRAAVPGFRNLRSPFRFAAVTQVAMVPLAGVALDHLWRSCARLRRGDLARGALVALVIVGLLEVVPGRTARTGLPDPDRSWVGWVRDHPDVGAVATVPFPSGGSVDDFVPTVEAMLLGLRHGTPLANGYSGLFPPSYEDLEAAMSDFPDRAAIDALVDRGVTHVVVDDAWSTARRRTAMAEEGLTEVHRGDGAAVWALPDR